MAVGVAQSTLDQVNAQIANANAQIAIHQQALARFQQEKADWQNVLAQLNLNAALNTVTNLL